MQWVMVSVHPEEGACLAIVIHADHLIIGNNRGSMVGDKLGTEQRGAEREEHHCVG